MSRLQVSTIENVVAGNPVTLVGSQIVDNTSQNAPATFTVKSDAASSASKLFSLRNARFSNDANGFSSEISFLTGTAAGYDGAIAFHTNDGSSASNANLPIRMLIKPSGEVEIGSTSASTTTTRLSITQSTSTYALEFRNGSRAYAFRIDSTSSALVLSDRTASVDRISVSAAGDVTLAAGISAATGSFSGTVTAATPSSLTETSTKVPTTAWIDAVFNGAGRCLKASNGYQKLPGTNGLILQWGLSDNVTPYNAVAITFPIAYPNACLQAYTTDGGNGMHNTGCGLFTTSGFTAYGGRYDFGSQTYEATSIRWFSIGY